MLLLCKIILISLSVKKYVVTCLNVVINVRANAAIVCSKPFKRSVSGEDQKEPSIFLLAKKNAIRSYIVGICALLLVTLFGIHHVPNVTWIVYCLADTQIVVRNVQLFVLCAQNHVLGSVHMVFVLFHVVVLV